MALTCQEVFSMSNGRSFRLTIAALLVIVSCLQSSFAFDLQPLERIVDRWLTQYDPERLVTPDDFHWQVLDAAFVNIRNGEIKPNEMILLAQGIAKDNGPVASYLRTQGLSLIHI